MKGITDEEFAKRYEAFERNGIEGFLARFERAGGELREGIEHLIREREKLRDEELAVIESEIGRLVGALQGVAQRKLLKEVECFRDVMALHRRLLDRSRP